MAKAIALLSGGLDSTLAAAIVKKQGVEVVGLTCPHPFADSREGAASACRQIGIPLETDDLGGEFFSLLDAPKHGFGRNLNPCIDCKIMMMRRAREKMAAWGASFLISGEVLGQRPKSQFRDALQTIERDAGVEGILVRPLSAKLLPPTIPEKEGVLRRDDLFDLSGRRRDRQIALARVFGIEEYEAPAGGCLLTEEKFCARLHDLIGRGVLTLDDVVLLKIGRHFRLSPGFKLAVGRNEGENERLLRIARPGDVIFSPEVRKGPDAVGRGRADEGLLLLAARIIARYCTVPEDAVTITYRVLPDGARAATPDGAPIAVTAEKLPQSLIDSLRIPSESKRGSRGRKTG